MQIFFQNFWYDFICQFAEFHDQMIFGSKDILKNEP